jgi:hypothetical protein
MCVGSKDEGGNPQCTWNLEYINCGVIPIFFWGGKIFRGGAGERGALPPTYTAITECTWRSGDLLTTNAARA